MRRLYTCLLTTLLPFIFIRFLLKGIKQKAYRRRWKERFGMLPFKKLSHSIWLHAVSLGEVNAALPLIKSLTQQYQDHPLVLTTTTPSGSMQVIKCLPTLYHAYVPIDLPYFINRFLNHIRPTLCIVMETEIWPNLIFSCARRHIPIFIANARLSSQSFKGYSHLKKWLTSVWKGIELIGVQTQLDCNRFIELGVPFNKLKLLGNLKFDMVIPERVHTLALTLREHIGKNRLIWVVASTHEGEEKIILQAFNLILKRYPNLLLILVPRHLPRFDTVANLLTQSELRFVRRSKMDNDSVSSTTQVLLVDVFGELLSCYAISDLAFVAGSIIAQGGHNLLEPAAFAKPVLSGSGLENFLFIRNLFLEKNALTIANTPKEIAQAVIAYLDNPQQMQIKGRLAKTIFEENQGALEKHLAIIHRYLQRSTDT
jgi:3-deoxy-D-manno-octulosonic-acid transferase